MKAFKSLMVALLLPTNVHLSVFETSEAMTQMRNQVPQIDHSVRIAHAQELLGKATARAAGVDASDVAGNVETLIEEKLKQHLSERDQHWAPAIRRAIVNASVEHSFDPLFILAVIWHESRFDIQARGGHGEIGLMQIKPSTAEWIAKKSGLNWSGPESLNNPVTNIRLATAYMSYLRDRFRSDAKAYVAAYNMGPLAVRRKLAQNITPSIYSNEVLGKYRRIYRRIDRRLPQPSSERMNLTWYKGLGERDERLISN